MKTYVPPPKVSSSLSIRRAAVCLCLISALPLARLRSARRARKKDPRRRRRRQRIVREQASTDAFLTDVWFSLSKPRQETSNCVHHVESGRACRTQEGGLTIRLVFLFRVVDSLLETRCAAQGPAEACGREVEVSERCR